MQPLQDRITNNVKIDDNGCWLWQRRITDKGYGQMWLTTAYKKGVTTAAHRVSYMAFKGSIPENLQIDHLCKVRNCVNPEHLEAVTAAENVYRSNALYKQQMARTHCPQGHEYTDDNIYRYKTQAGGVCRNCKICMKSRTKARYQAKKELLYAA